MSGKNIIGHLMCTINLQISLVFAVCFQNLVNLNKKCKFLKSACRFFLIIQYIDQRFKLPSIALNK